jgi:hypothetical protein
MGKNKLFSWGNTEGIPHPREPVTTTFCLIALPTAGDKIGSKILATRTARTNMIECKFMKFIGHSAINTLTIEVLFNGTSPHPFGFRTCHGY